MCCTICKKNYGSVLSVYNMYMQIIFYTLYADKKLSAYALQCTTCREKIILIYTICGKSQPLQNEKQNSIQVKIKVAFCSLKQKSLYLWQSFDLGLITSQFSSANLISCVIRLSVNWTESRARNC